MNPGLRTLRPVPGDDQIVVVFGREHDVLGVPVVTEAAEREVEAGRESRRHREGPVRNDLLLRTLEVRDRRLQNRIVMALLDVGARRNRALEWIKDRLPRRRAPLPQESDGARSVL